MTNKSNYKTKQFAYLLDYLKASDSKHFTVNDLYVHFKENGLNIGISTLYRNLEKLIEDGLVVKYASDGKQSACFEYIGNHQSHSSHCYHAKCQQCGALLHINCDYLEKLQKILQQEQHFLLDLTKTTLVGLCSQCQTQNKQQ